MRIDIKINPQARKDKYDNWQDIFTVTFSADASDPPDLVQHAIDKIGEIGTTFCNEMRGILPWLKAPEEVRQDQ